MQQTFKKHILFAKMTKIMWALGSQHIVTSSVVDWFPEIPLAAALRLLTYNLCAVNH